MTEFYLRTSLFLATYRYFFCTGTPGLATLRFNKKQKQRAVKAAKNAVGTLGADGAGGGGGGNKKRR